MNNSDTYYGEMMQLDPNDVLETKMSIERHLRETNDILKTKVEVLERDNKVQQKVIQEIDKKLGKAYGAEQYLHMARRCGEKEIEIRKLQTQVEKLEWKLKESVDLLKAGKREFAPHTTNSTVDEFIQRYEQAKTEEEVSSNPLQLAEDEGEKS